METYWWLTLRVAPEAAELVQDGLFELGATGLEEVEEIPGATDGTVLLKAFFPDRAACDRAREAHRDGPDLAFGEAPVEDWDRSWRDRQTPVEVTPDLVVVPPWVDAGPARHVIRLEAKMAFGTGSHESTRIAALLLEALPGTGDAALPLRGRSVLDIGAGTGILALYAGLLGASRVLALDIDPVTGPCLRENQALNPLPPGCRFQPYVGELASLRADARFDVIICNMIRTELWPFRAELRGRLRPGGHFVVSGQRQEDKPHFLAWRKQAPFRIAAERSLDAWWGFAGTLE